MSGARLLTIAGCELRALCRRPLLWSLVGVLGLITWGLSTGDLKLGTGTAFVGGKRAWITSEFSTAFSMAVLAGSFYAFFVAITSGTPVIRDQELKIGELLHATSLKPREYIWGKFLAVLAAFGLIVGLQVLLTIFFNHVVPGTDSVGIRGPFSLWSYLRPALVFMVPTLVFFAGVSFWIGERWRRPVWVFLFPIVIVFTVFTFLWNWTPSWLDPTTASVLMLLDPSGFRWLNETWLLLDRGVDFYNTTPIGLDPLFLISRLGWLVVGLGFVALAARHFATSLEGSATHASRVEPQTSPIRAIASRRPVAELAMTAERPSFWASTRDVARFELTTLLRQPALYLFAAFIMMEVLVVTLIRTGPFQTGVIVTSGQFAVWSMNTLSLLVTLALMFFTVESMERENRCGLAAIFYSSPTSSAAVLLGKGVATSVVGGLILLAHVLACAVVLAIQGRVGLEPGAFGVTWGLLLVPTFLAWTTWIIALRALTGERYLTYGLGLGTIGLTLYHEFTEGLTWVSNWLLWGSLKWSDMGAFQFNAQALLLNRLLLLSVTVLLAFVAVRALRRQQPDSHDWLARLRPQPLVRAALGWSPLVVAPIALGSVLWLGVSNGFQGHVADEARKDYWKQNLATWRDAPQPAAEHIDLDVILEPEKRAFTVDGRSVLVNLNEEPLERFALTGWHGWRDLRWSLAGEAFEPDNRSSLFVFALDEPLAPGERIEVGFHLSGSWPDGMTRDGGGDREFVLPSGALLSNIFGSYFIPRIGFDEEYGVLEENRYDGREYLDGFHENRLSPALGNQIPFTTRVQVTAPEEYGINSVGVKTAESVADGLRTVVWESDHPVRLVNIVAGRWKERRGDGTAIYYHPGHEFNLDQIAEVLDGAKRHFSDWFHPYPWQELKLSEFPAMDQYGAAFPTNIVFSEGIGFLTKPSARSDAVFLVTAHETAHQWWANLLTPADAPGGVVLSEGMSHFATLLLSEEMQSRHHRMEMARRFEEAYVSGRFKDAERPLARLDGTRRGEATVWYNKGGLVFWMMLELMGREAMLDGLRAFILEWKDGPDYPVLEDFVASMRPFARDVERYDRFTGQWFFDVVLPEYRLSDVDVESRGGQHHVTLTIENGGTGSVPVELAAIRGKRFDDDGQPLADYRELRQTLTLGPGESRKLSFTTPFEPQRLVVDPDVKVIQFRRKHATAKL